jgi:hypothetical protein
MTAPALRALIEAVKRGKDVPLHNFNVLPNFSKDDAPTARFAFIANDPRDYRALGAALVVKDALAPNWTRWEVRCKRSMTRFVAELERLADNEWGVEAVRAEAPTPARALLLAVLEAYEKEGE